MGNVTNIAKSNEFWIKNLIEFREGLYGFIGGELENPPYYTYLDYKRKSKNALISLDSKDFSISYYKKDNEDETLNFLEYLKIHMIEDEVCIIHLVSYEHASDMSITKYIVTSEKIEEIIILED